MASTGFESSGYQKVYAAAGFPTSDSATRISAWIKELFPHPDVKVIFVFMIVRPFPPDTGTLGEGYSSVVLDEPCNTTNGVVRGEGVLTGFGIVHGNIEVTCETHPTIPEFVIGIRVDSPPFSAFPFETKNNGFHAELDVPHEGIIIIGGVLLPGDIGD